MPSRPPSKTSEDRRPLLPSDGEGRKRARIVFVIGLGFLGLWVAWDFMAPLAWAMVLAMSLWPLHTRFAARITAGRTTASVPALLFTLAVGVLLFLPVGLALHQAAQEGQALSRFLANARQHGVPVPPWLPDVPLGEYGVSWWKTNLADPQGVSALLGENSDTENGAGWSRSVAGQVLHRSFLFLVALAALFVLLRDGDWIARRVMGFADGLLGDPGERLASKVVETVRGTVNGTVAVAVLEGLLIGVAYVLAGVPNPLLFALMTMAFAMVPLGAWVVFSAASLLVLLKGGSGLAAAGVFGFGATVMLVGDLLVWPALIGNAARLPFLLALIGIFGGLQAFGLVGLFVGPMILAALWTVWREWLGRPRPEPKRQTASG
jgi:predicted PurR-regulated permease PerM